MTAPPLLMLRSHNRLPTRTSLRRKSSCLPTLRYDRRRLSPPLYRQIAYHLLKGDYPKEFRIAAYREYPDPDDEREYNHTSHALSLFDNPAGIVVKQGQDLLVLVCPTGGKKLGLWLVNYDVPGGDGVNGRKMLPIEEGANLLSMPQDGHLYIGYYGEDYTKPRRSEA